MVLLRQLLGDVLRRLRIRQGRTLREVSASARVSLGYLSEVERGRKEASSELLAAICAALETPLSQVLADLEAAASQIPRDEYPAEAAPLAAAMEKPRRGMGHGPVLIGEILPVVLARLGVKPVQSEPSEELDRT